MDDEDDTPEETREQFERILAENQLSSDKEENEVIHVHILLEGASNLATVSAVITQLVADMVATQSEPSLVEDQFDLMRALFALADEYLTEAMMPMDDDDDEEDEDE